MNGPGPLTTLRDRIAGGELTAEAAVRTVARRHRPPRPHAPRLHGGDRRTAPRGSARRRRCADARRAAGPAGRRPDRGQGQHLHPHAADDGGLGGTARLPAALRRHGGVAAGRRRRHRRRQDQLRRIRDGLLDRELGLRPHPQSLGARSHARGIEWRIGRGRGQSVVPAALGLRYRRLDPSAGGVLRRGRPQAHLRPGLALRPARLRVVARSDRAVHHHGRRRGAGAGGDGRRPTRTTRPAPPVRCPTGRASLRPRRRRPAHRGAAAASSTRASTRPCCGPSSDALAAWQDAGATLVDVDLPNAPLAIPVYYLIATAEASSNLARYDGVRYGHRAALSASRRPARDVRTHARRGLRRRGQAPHHARHVRLERRLSRRLLREGAAGAGEAPRRLRRARSRQSTSSPRRPRRRRRSGSARRPPTRCRCTWPTSSR